MPVLTSDQEVKDLLQDIADDGVFFGAFAKRRRDGTVKHWNAKATTDTFNERDEKNGLATVFDAKAGHPKSLALEGIKKIRCYGQEFVVADDGLPF